MAGIGYDGFTFSNPNFLILMFTETFSRTPSGKSWRKNPDKEDRAVVSARFFTNYVRSISFINRFGNGASCKAVPGPTPAGYLPDYVITVLPGKEKRILTSFDFIDNREMLSAAGWREREVIENARRYEFDMDDRLTLYTDDKGVTASATWDGERWVD